MSYARIQRGEGGLGSGTRKTWLIASKKHGDPESLLPKFFVPISKMSTLAPILKFYIMSEQNQCVFVCVRACVRACVCVCVFVCGYRLRFAEITLLG